MLLRRSYVALRRRLLNVGAARDHHDACVGREVTNEGGELRVSHLTQSGSTEREGNPWSVVVFELEVSPDRLGLHLTSTRTNLPNMVGAKCTARRLGRRSTLQNKSSEAPRSCLPQAQRDHRLCLASIRSC